MTSMTNQTDGLQYEKSPEGIHIFQFAKEGDGGLDEFFAILEGILRETPIDTTLRYIVQLEESNNTGMRDLVKRFGKLEAKIPRRAPGRTAIVHKGDIFLMLANTFLNLAPNQDKTKFFRHTEYERAKTWVLRDD